jgi:hypothetical protein
VHPAQLGDRVIAVFEKHPIVELFGSSQPHGSVDGVVTRHIEVADKLVEKQPPQALGRS